MSDIFFDGDSGLRFLALLLLVLPLFSLLFQLLFLVLFTLVLLPFLAVGGGGRAI